MKSRCLNPRDKSFSLYGGKGITVCERWGKSFENFVADMGERPIGKTLDRIDGSKGYNKENCRWASPTEQKMNQSVTKRIDFNGKSLVSAEWSKEVNIPEHTLFQRIYRGWTIEEALTIPLKGKPSKKGFSRESSKKLTFNGESLSIKQWADKAGIPLSTLKQRIKLGWSHESALTKPIDSRKSKSSSI